MKFLIPNTQTRHRRVGVWLHDFQFFIEIPYSKHTNTKSQSWSPALRFSILYEIPHSKHTNAKSQSWSSALRFSLFDEVPYSKHANANSQCAMTTTLPSRSRKPQRRSITDVPIYLHLTTCTRVRVRLSVRTPVLCKVNACTGPARQTFCPDLAFFESLICTRGPFKVLVSRSRSSNDKQNDDQTSKQDSKTVARILHVRTYIGRLSNNLFRTLCFAS